MNAIVELQFVFVRYWDLYCFFVFNTFFLFLNFCMHSLIWHLSLAWSFLHQQLLYCNFWATVLPMLSDRCPVLSCLSVTLVCCGQTVRWIRMPHGMEVGLAQPPRPHCVRWVRWGSSSPTPKGAQQPPLFGPCLLWPNGWMNRDATWYGGRSRLRPHCVRWGPSSAIKRGTAAPLFGPCVLSSNGHPWFKVTSVTR